MKYEDLIKLIDAGFTKEDILKLNQAPKQEQEEKKVEEKPAEEAPTAPTTPAFDIDALVMKVADEIDARTAKRQQANRTKDLSNGQDPTIDDPTINDILKNFLS